MAKSTQSVPRTGNGVSHGPEGSGSRGTRPEIKSAATPGGSAEPGHATASAGGEDSGEAGLDRMKNIGTHLADELRTAATSMLDEQKGRAAEQVAGLADMLRHTAESLDDSQGRSFAPYANDAADSVERLATAIKERPWTDIAADTEQFARRQPLAFMLGALAAGFIAGRFLTASAERNRGGTLASLDPAGRRHRGLGPATVAIGGPPRIGGSGGGI